MAQAGYSGTPLPRKLGLKQGQRVLFIELPEDLGWLREADDFALVQERDWVGPTFSDHWNVIHAFTRERRHLDEQIGALMAAITRDGMIWISWPKKASKVPTDMSEDVIREVALPIGLVDVKVCAVDDIWSGLKLVIRKELR